MTECHFWTSDTYLYKALLSPLLKCHMFTWIYCVFTIKSLCDLLVIVCHRTLYPIVATLHGVVDIVPVQMWVWVSCVTMLLWSAAGRRRLNRNNVGRRMLRMNYSMCLPPYRPPLTNLIVVRTAPCAFPMHTPDQLGSGRCNSFILIDLSISCPEVSGRDL